MKIAVYGSAAGDIDPAVSEKAKVIGEEIARRGHVLITGACPGLPYDAVLGAKEHKGEVIGFSPGVNLDDHRGRFRFPIDGFTGFVYVPGNYVHRNNAKVCEKYRNVSSVAECDAAVIISGRSGTMNELTSCYDLEKDIGVLTETGGNTPFIPALVRKWNKPSGSRIIYDANPIKLVESLEELAAQK